MADNYDRFHILRSRTRAQESREDTTALLLCKLVHIVEDNQRPYYTLMEELKADPERMENVVHALVGLVVQYAEGARGFLALCEHLIGKLKERKLDELPGIQTKWGR